MKHDVTVCGDVYLADGTIPRISEEVLDVLESSKSVICNLESAIGSISPHRPMTKYSTLISSPRVVDLLKEMNVTAVVLANNHFMDYGVAASSATFKILKDEKIGFFGAGQNRKEAFSVYEDRKSKITAKGATTIFVPDAAADQKHIGVATIRVTTQLNIPISEPIEEPVAPYLLSGTINASDIKEMKISSRGNNLKMAFVHWGIGEGAFNSIVMEYQKTLGSILTGMGYDLVIGTHPHILQPIEIRSKNMIIYSLGNFFFMPHMNGMAREGTMFSFDKKEMRVSLHFTIQDGRNVNFLKNPFNNLNIKRFLESSSFSGTKYEKINGGISFYL